MKKVILIIFTAMALTALPARAQRIAIAHIDTTTMTAPGNSLSVWVGSGLYKLLTWDFTVSNINSKVAVALQKKTGNGEWTGIFADSLVYTRNGNFSLVCDQIAFADSVRFKWISEAGGTAATIKHNAKLFGGI